MANSEGEVAYTYGDHKVVRMVKVWNALGHTGTGLAVVSLPDSVWGNGQIKIGGNEPK